MAAVREVEYDGRGRVLPSGPVPDEECRTPDRLGRGSWKTLHIGGLPWSSAPPRPVRTGFHAKRVTSANHVTVQSGPLEPRRLSEWTDRQPTAEQGPVCVLRSVNASRCCSLCFR